MTAVTKMANPYVERIKESGFTEYYYERFPDTLIRYGRGKEVFELWKEGINSGIFLPELHGREHLSTQLWLGELKKGNRDLVFAFDNGFAYLNVTGLAPEAKNFRPEFYFY